MATKKARKPIKTNTLTASKTQDGLNLQMEEFCHQYINGERDLFGNGTKCYLAVYGAEYKINTGKNMSYEVAMSNASRLLRKDKIIKRINTLLETGGFTEENVDRQHTFLINQHADFKTKMAAIKEFNALKGRITKKVQVDTGERLSKYLDLIDGSEDTRD